MADARTRNWLFVCYPDSMPDDWRSVIDSWGVTCYLSPLHDADIKDDGTFKKPHYHGIICFEGVKSYGQVLALVSQLGCMTAKVCNSFVNALRYLTHMDNKDKVQYDVSSIQTWGHADLSAMYEKTSREENEDVLDVLRLIDFYSLSEFSELVVFLAQEYPNDLFPTLRKNHMFFKNYMQSRHFSFENYA